MRGKAVAIAERAYWMARHKAGASVRALSGFAPRRLTPKGGCRPAPMRRKQTSRPGRGGGGRRDLWLARRTRQAKNTLKAPPRRRRCLCGLPRGEARCATIAHWRDKLAKPTPPATEQKPQACFSGRCQREQDRHHRGTAARRLMHG